MPRLLPALVLTLASLALAGPVAAQDQAEEVAIAKMDTKQLIQLVATITGSIGQDTLKMQPAAQRGDCLELTRTSNAFALGYSMLADVDAALVGRPPQEAVPIKVQVIQSRVITFAARVRADEWLSRRCASYVVPAEHSAEVRYAKPLKVQTAEYTQAVIEARQAAEANLASAVGAGMSKKCPEVLGAMQSIQLLVPYLEKLIKDVGQRPEALGPRASRRGLEVARLQLVNAGNKLYREVGMGCAGAPPPVAEEGTAPPAEAPQPANEGAPAAP